MQFLIAGLGHQNGTVKETLSPKPRDETSNYKSLLMPPGVYFGSNYESLLMLTPGAPETRTHECFVLLIAHCLVWSVVIRPLPPYCEH